MRKTIGKIFYYLGLATFLPFVISDSKRSRVGLICGDEILLSKTTVSDQKWTLLGGGKHRNESIKECAVREIKEETGLNLKKSQMNVLKTEEHEIFHKKYKVTLIAVHLNKKPEIKYPKLEILDVEWFKLDKLPSNTHIVVKNFIKALEQ